jgi:hypothetical protein
MSATSDSYTVFGADRFAPFLGLGFLAAVARLEDLRAFLLAVLGFAASTLRLEAAR